MTATIPVVRAVDYNRLAGYLIYASVGGVTSFQ